MTKVTQHEAAIKAVDTITNEIFDARGLTEEEFGEVALPSVHYCNGETWIEFGGRGLWDSENYPYETYTDAQENVCVETLTNHLRAEIEIFRRLLVKTIPAPGRNRLTLVTNE